MYFFSLPETSSIIMPPKMTNIFTPSMIMDVYAYKNRKFNLFSQ